MAVGPSNKGSGKLKRTTIDPRIGGTKGDAGPAGKAGKSGLGTAGGARSRTKIDPRIGGQKGDAGFSGKAKGLSGFGKAFSVALAKGPNTAFTFGGKKYKAVKKHEMKGPSASRVEDKSISAASSVKGRPEGKNPPLKTYTVDGKKVSALNRQEALKKAGLNQIGAGAFGAARKKKPTNAGGQRLGQRKAGGIMKAKDGAAVKKQAKKMAGMDENFEKNAKKAFGKVKGTSAAYALAKAKASKDRMTGQDVKEAKKVVGKRTGGVMKAFLGNFAVKQGIKTLTKNQKETLMNMPDKQRQTILKRLKEAKAEKVPKLNKAKVIGTLGVIAGAGNALLKTGKKGKAKAKRKEDKVSQADIIGKGSKKGRMGGGMMKKYNQGGGMKKYNAGGFPDLSGDGKVTQKDILMGKGVVKKRGGGIAIKGNNFKGTF